MKIKLTRAELAWVERSADIETAQLFKNFNHILSIYKDTKDKPRELLNKQITELIDLYTFLKTLRSKLELWDCRYDIDTEIGIKDKGDKK